MRRHPTIVGHRGAAAVAPENTLASLDRAVRDGADAVEFDVRLTADGRPVLLHDATLDRTTDGTGPVRARSFEEVRSLDAGSWFDAAYRGERVPTLEDALRVLPARVHAYVELKSASDRDEALLDAVLHALAAARREGGATVSGSAWDLLALPRPQWSAIRRGLVFQSGSARDPVAFAAESGIEEIHPNWRRLDEAFRRCARSAGLALRPYTVNGGKALDAALRFGVDSIITDDPGAMRRALRAEAGR